MKRLKRVLLGCALSLCAVSAFAQVQPPPLAGVPRSASLPAPRAPLGHVTLTVSSAAAPLPNIPAGATVCYLSLVGGDVNWRDDAAPTAVAGGGTRWTAGTPFTLFSSPPSGMQFIAVSGTPVIDGGCY